MPSGGDGLQRVLELEHDAGPVSGISPAAMRACSSWSLSSLDQRPPTPSPWRLGRLDLRPQVEDAGLERVLLRLELAWRSRRAAPAPGSCSGRAGPRTRAGPRRGSRGRAARRPSVSCQLGIGPEPAHRASRRGVRCPTPPATQDRDGDDDGQRAERDEDRPAIRVPRRCPGGGLAGGGRRPGRPRTAPGPGPRRRPRAARGPGRPGPARVRAAAARTSVGALAPRSSSHASLERRHVDPERRLERLVVGAPVGVRADERHERVLAVGPDEVVDRGRRSRRRPGRTARRSSGTGRSGRRAG